MFPVIRCTPLVWVEATCSEKKKNKSEKYHKLLFKLTSPFPLMFEVLLGNIG